MRWRSLAADLGTRDGSHRAIIPRESESLLADLPRYQCSDGGLYRPGWPSFGNAYLTSYVLRDESHERPRIPSDDAVIGRAGFPEAR